jgi:uncharacterized membrane protein YheB (UPF0754 family)
VDFLSATIGGDFNLTFWRFVFPPLFYTFHGWIATKMAIWALFHPYNAWYFPGTKWQIPCTPGIFPKRQAKLAQAVAGTITDTLLTTTDIKIQAETLVTERNIHIAVDAFVTAILKEFRDTAKLHRLANDIAELSPAVLEHVVLQLINDLETGRDTKVATITEKIFDHTIMHARISLDQATEISSRLMETVLTPQRIRNAALVLLSPQNINAIDESIQAHAGGPYRILAKIIGVKRVCYEWRNFFEREPDEAHKVIADLTKRFGIRDQIAIQIANFDMRTMPVQTVNQLRANLVNYIQNFLVEHREDVMEAVRKIQGEARATVRQAIIRFNPTSVPEPWLSRAKQDISVFFYAYLQRELGELLEKAIPQLGMYELITRKIGQFSPKQLEMLIHRLCEQELKWLAWLGGFIGLLMGLVQVLVNYLVK